MILCSFGVVALWKSCENLALFSLLGVSPFSKHLVSSHCPPQAIWELRNKQEAFSSYFTDNHSPVLWGMQRLLLFRDQDSRNGMGRTWAMAQSSLNLLNRDGTAREAVDEG